MSASATQGGHNNGMHRVYDCIFCIWFLWGQLLEHFVPFCSVLLTTNITVFVTFVYLSKQMMMMTFYFWSAFFNKNVCCVFVLAQFYFCYSCMILSERELTFVFATCDRPSVCLSSVCLSLTLVHPTQAVVIFVNISTAFGTLAIR